jgi:glycosyltransferase involved in cell wall biosynthesis
VEKIRVLVVSQYFYPENFKCNDIAFELQRRGYDVTVLTGIPNYPKGSFLEGYGYFKRRREVVNGVKVKRVFLLPRGNNRALSLFLNYFSWAFFACIYAVYLGLFKKFDKVFVHQASPVTMGLPGVIVKRIQNIPMYFWVLDLWPESLVSAGGVKNKYILGVFEQIVRLLYRNATKILITSRGFVKSICAKGDFKDKIIHFPNWADSDLTNTTIQYSLPQLPEGFIVMFAGNIGVAQDVENIINAARITNEKYPSIKYVFLGDGRDRERIEKLVQDYNLNDTVVFLGKHPLESMSLFFEKADCMLVSLKDEEIFNLTLPAKVQAYMSASKPILAMMNGEGYDTILDAKCGYSAPAENSKALADNVVKIFNLTKEERMHLGINGFEYYKKNFQLDNCMNHLEEIIK